MDEVTYIGGDAANDDLTLASGLDGSAEVSIVPGVNLTAPADDGDVRVHGSDLREERAVGTLNTQGNGRSVSCFVRKAIGEKDTLIRAGGDDNGEVVDLAKTSVEYDVVVHGLGVVVTDDAYEANLVVDDEQRGVIPINPLKLVCGD